MNGGVAQAVLPVSAFPCEISEGQKFYVLKLHEDTDAVLVCRLEQQGNNND